MTAGQRGFLPAVEVARTERYLTEVKHRLGLSAWDVYVATTPCDEDNHAHVEPCTGRKVAPVHLSAEWYELGPEKKRETIVHELLHLVHRDQTDLIRVALPESGYLPDGAYRMLWESFRLATEVMVDHFAAMLAPLMPAWPVDDDETATGVGGTP